MAGYQGKFGNVPAAELFKRDDWYQEMFITSGGNYSRLSFLAYAMLLQA